MSPKRKRPARGARARRPATKSLFRGASLFVTSGVLPKARVDNIRRMPGAFVPHHGRIAAEFRLGSVADKLDWFALIDRASSA